MTKTPVDAVPRAAAPANKLFAAVDGVLDTFDRAAALADTLGLKMLADQLAAGLGTLRRNLLYQTPEVHWAQETALVNGTVRGNVGALSDIAGASFEYSVYSQPTEGKVTLDPMTGDFVYTLDPGQTSVSGVGFTIKVADRNPTSGNIIDSRQKTYAIETVSLGDPGYQTTWVVNATTKPITYAGYQNGGEVDNGAIAGDASAPYTIYRAVPGAVSNLSDFSVAMDVDPTKNPQKLNTLMPGERLAFTTIYYNLSNNDSVLNFAQLDGGQTLQAVGQTTWTNGNAYCLSGAQCGGGAGEKGPALGSPGNVNVVIFQDEKPDTVSIDATQRGDVTVGSATYTRDEAFAILARIMTRDNTSLSNVRYQTYTQLDPLNPPTLTIDGKPLSAELTLPIGWGGAVYNLSPADAEKTIGASVGAEAQFGFEIGLETGIKVGENVLVEEAEAELSAHVDASWDWSKSQEFSVEVTEPVPAYSVSVLYTTHDMIAQAADSTTNFYNTAWVVKGNQNLYTDYSKPTGLYYVMQSAPIQDKASGAGFSVGINGSPADKEFRTSATLKVGDEPLQVNAFAFVGDRGGEGQVWTDKGTVWTSSDPAVASVTSGQVAGNGIVTPRGAGSAVITATYNWTLPSPESGGSNLEGSVTNSFLVTVPQQTALTTVKSNGATTLLKNDQDIAYVQYGTGTAFPVTRDDDYWTGEVPINRPNNARFLSIAPGPVNEVVVTIDGVYEINTPYLLLDRSDFGAFQWTLDPFGQFVSSSQLTTEQALADAATRFGVPRSDLPSAAPTNEL